MHITMTSRPSSSQPVSPAGLGAGAQNRRRPRRRRTGSLPAPPWVSVLGSASGDVAESVASLPCGLEPSPPGGAWTATLADALLVRTPSRSSVTLVMPGEWVPLGGSPRPASSQQPMEEALLDFWAAKENELVELELESTELEPLGFGVPTGQESKLESEITARSQPPSTKHTPGYSRRAKRRREPQDADLESPTLRAVRATLAKGRPVSVPSAEPEKVPSARRVFLHLDEPSLQEPPQPGPGLGEDSVWLEFGEPGLAEEVTERGAPDDRGRRAADVVADGGAVRVDLSLGTTEAPDLEQRRRSSEDRGDSRSRPGPEVGSSEPVDLLTYSGSPTVGETVRKLEDEATERGPDWEEP